MADRNYLWSRVRKDEFKKYCIGQKTRDVKQSYLGTSLKFQKNFTEIHFRDSPILKNFAEISFHDMTFSGSKKVYYSRFWQKIKKFYFAKTSFLNLASLLLFSHLLFTTYDDAGKLIPSICLIVEHCLREQNQDTVRRKMYVEKPIML